MTEQYGADPSLWQIKTPSQLLGINNFRGVPQTSAENELSLPVIANRGTENNIFVADGRHINGWDVFAPGQSGFVSPQGERSPHYSDQMELYRRFGKKALPFTESEVKAVTGSKTLLRVEIP